MNTIKNIKTGEMILRWDIEYYECFLSQYNANELPFDRKEYQIVKTKIAELNTKYDEYISKYVEYFI